MATVVSVCFVDRGGAACEAGLEAVLRPLDGHMAGGQAALLTQVEVEEEQDGPRQRREEAAIAEVAESDTAHGRASIIGCPSSHA